MKNPIRVLVVDEDRDVLDLTETFLERESDVIEAITERDPEAAAQRVRDEDFDCVVSDYRMPGMDGLELYEVISAHDSTLPFFLVTASTGSDAAAEADKVGVAGFIRKGAGTDHYVELARRIESAVSG